MANKPTPKRNKSGVIVTKRKVAARSMRDTSRRNPDGSQSTHVMEWGSGSGRGKNKYTVNPTIFPNKDGSWTDKGPTGDAHKEAQKRGEVIGFRSAKRAEKFAAGSWKKGSDRKESMKQYRSDKKSGNLYTQSKDFKIDKKTKKK